MKKIVIICKGGFGGEMQTYIRDCFPEGSGYVLSDLRDLFPDEPFTAAPDEVFVVANGDPAVKAALVRKIEAGGGRLISVIHPTCYVASTAKVGEGALLCPFAFVGPGAELAPHVTMNVHSGCGHNSRLDSFAVLSPYASVSGAAHLEEEVFMGSHAYVAPKVQIGARAKISTGAFAIDDVPADALAVGNPARILKNFYA